MYRNSQKRYYEPNEIYLTARLREAKASKPSAKGG